MKKISIVAYFFTKKLVWCLIFLKNELVYQMMLIDRCLYIILSVVHILIFQIQSTLSFRFISVGFIFKANVKKEFFLAEMYVLCYTAIQLQTMWFLWHFFLSVYIFTTIFFQHKKRCIMTLVSVEKNVYNSGKYWLS